jgi:hypothetical protein
VLNELRDVVADQGKDFARSEGVDARFQAMSDRIGRLETHEANTAGKGSGADYLWRSAVAVIGMLIAGATLYGAFHH